MNIVLIFEQHPQRIIDDLIAQQVSGPDVSVGDVARVTARHFHMTMQELRGPRRAQQIVLARQLAMYLTRELTDLQLDDTPVSDLTPLSKLTKLEKLSIQRTRVKDLKPLKELKSLKFVYINGAPVDEPFVIMRPGLKVVDQ